MRKKWSLIDESWSSPWSMQKGINYVVAKRVQGHVSETRHTFFFSLFESSNYGTGSNYNPMGLTSIRVGDKVV